MHKIHFKHFGYGDTAAIQRSTNPFARFFGLDFRHRTKEAAGKPRFISATSLLETEPPKKRSRMKDTASFILENMKKNACTVATYCVGKLPPYWQDVVKLGWKSAMEERKTLWENAKAHFSSPQQKAISALTAFSFGAGFLAILAYVPKEPSAGWFSVSSFSLAFGVMATTLSEFYSQFALFSKKSKTAIKNTFSHLLIRSLTFGAVIGIAVSAVGTANVLNFANHVSDAIGNNPLARFASLYIFLQAWMLVYSFSFVYLRDKVIEKRIDSKSESEREKNLKNSFASAFKSWLFTIPVDFVFCAVMLPFSGIVSYPIAMIATLTNSIIRVIATEQRWDSNMQTPVNAMLTFSKDCRSKGSNPASGAEVDVF